MPIAEPCPKCGAPFIVEKKTKIGTVHACLKEGCDWEQLVPEAPPPQAQQEEVVAPVGAKP
jgi:ssDNA-binding Zn-finger/Zn-ribbon topoisomerase 1